MRSQNTELQIINKLQWSTDSMHLKFEFYVFMNQWMQQKILPIDKRLQRRMNDKLLMRMNMRSSLWPQMNFLFLIKYFYMHIQIEMISLVSIKKGSRLKISGKSITNTYTINHLNDIQIWLKSIVFDVGCRAKFHFIWHIMWFHVAKNT